MMPVHQSARHRVRILQYLEHLLTLVHQLTQYSKYVLVAVKCLLMPVHQ